MIILIIISTLKRGLGNACKSHGAKLLILLHLDRCLSFQGLHIIPQLQSKEC